MPPRLLYEVVRHSDAQRRNAFRGLGILDQVFRKGREGSKYALEIEAIMTGDRFGDVHQGDTIKAELLNATDRRDCGRARLSG